ncbi:MAG: FapA family protein [Fibrobacterales bacterium]
MAIKEVTLEELEKTLTCSIDEDGYVASVTVVKELTLREVTQESLKKYLNEHDVCVGILPFGLKRIINGIKKSTIGVPTVIARGTPKEESIEGIYASPFVDSDKNNAPIEGIRKVRAGQVVLTYKPAVRGKPGIRISGEMDPVTPFPLHDKPIPASNIQVIEENDTTSFISMQHGHVAINRNSWSIETTYTHVGPFTSDSAPINFPGDIVIRGDIEGGTDLNVKGNLTVVGSINRGAMIHTDGVLTVQKEIGCGDSGHCSADVTIIAKSCTGSTISSKGDIVIQSMVMNSTIHCGGTFATPKGVIMDSTIHTLKGCTIHSIGVPEKETQNCITAGVFTDPLDQEETRAPDALITITHDIYNTTTLINGAKQLVFSELTHGPTRVKFFEID